MEALAPALAISVITLTLGATFILRGPLGRALGERLSSRTPRDDGEVDQLRAEVDELRGVVGELQERLDFAERLLAQQRDAGKLPS